ncbi:lytic murein transglycosylase [Rhodovibrio salinarum]|uniref:Lytic murein transglycosylase n=1 Tax=Rhodovibrio salinarum TaxID=1087 RepID=A0A934QK29_9PROT|nr:lytic murein transglycosylase [Rhodovibrio salinarum]MBK1697985.1 lytic murein transglycosylase [Rhodovibrio salinarum]
MATIACLHNATRPSGISPRRRWLGIWAGLATAVALIATPGMATAQQDEKQAVVAPQNDQPFEQWLQDLRDEARTQGIAASTLESALTDVAPVNRVIELDRQQPEFTQTFWSYLDKRVSEQRIQRGREMLAEHRDLLQRVADDYGVQPRFLVAFWGLETNFGDYLGSFHVIDALATLAYDQRRPEFFRAQLLDALRIVDQGHVTADGMMGSWAGAMGHLQFIPSTFVNHAVDRTGDGKKDIWGTLPDVFASGANYLSDLGWKGDELWGREVVLPDGFDLRQASLSVRKPLDAWAKLGVRKANGQPLSTPAGMQGSIVLPQGHAGPAFLVYENFRHILSWNRSINYAIAVGHLADRIVGLPAIQHGRDADNRPLSFDQAEEIQRLLNRLGFDAGPVDGVPGSQTRAAIRAFQSANDLPADGYASVRLLERLRQKATQ